MITEHDSLSTLICRKCEGLVSKASELDKELKLCKCNWNKRCVELSPSCKPPSKRLTSELRHVTTDSSSKQLNFGESSAQATQQVPIQEASLSLLPLASALEEPLSMPDDPETQLHGGDTSTEGIVRAANSQLAIIVADVKKKRCQSVLTALKSAIADEIATACQTLC